MTSDAYKELQGIQDGFLEEVQVLLESPAKAIDSLSS
jgi:hypothetical protein